MPFNLGIDLAKNIAAMSPVVVISMSREHRAEQPQRQG